jgi:ankyrin repeat domain-containing protein 50
VQGSLQNADRASKNRALELAIERHLNALPRAEAEAFREASKSLTDENILLEVETCDADHKGKSHFRPQAEALSRFLGLLDRFVAGITIGIQANPDISAIVVGGVRLVITMAVGFTTFFARLSEMLCRFGDFLGPLAEYAKASIKEDLFVRSACQCIWKSVEILQASS